MAKENIEVLVEGGKATAAPPLGPALGPMGVNIGQVVGAINEKTKVFAGMKVPVTVTVDSTTKTFEISIGTPPASQLLKKEAGIAKGSGNPKADKVADVLIEQVIKVAKMKETALLGKTLKDKVKEIMGTCQSMGILVEGKPAHDAIIEVNAGKFDVEIKSEKTELTKEEKAKLEEEKKHLAEEIQKKKAELDAKAKEIMTAMAGKEKSAIKAKLREAGIPDVMIRELLPSEAEAKPGAEGAAKPAAGAAAEKKPAAK
ncbi:MAG: 50S ribosomal protein L11 [Nanoarchaeota archaeon]|nr:50S ribosomal protein L11 [Nanoarchaeota archaeon]MBU1705072.1 50S ribosomal protein L11 [Nanoarchaeota archaeon]